jgi:cellulose synthase/poly-beta-1,6-N-acetylglucosamine synthase-like glycosyltransferase
LPKGWLKSLVSTAENEEAVMVCGTVIIKKDSGVLIEMQVIETLILQSAGAASLYNLQPLLNTGASMLFRRDKYLEIGKFDSHINIASGDDTFLMLDFFEKFKDRVIPDISADAMVTTNGAHSLNEIVSQRLRWSTKVKHYQSLYIKATGAIILLSALFFVVQLLQCIFLDGSLIYLFFIFSLRVLAEQRFLSTVARFRRLNFRWLTRILMMIIYPLFLIYMAVAGLFIKPEWKGRPL